jgi:hypothetical protein
LDVVELGGIIAWEPRRTLALEDLYSLLKGDEAAFVGHWCRGLVLLFEGLQHDGFDLVLKVLAVEFEETHEEGAFIQLLQFWVITDVSGNHYKQTV